MLNTTNKSGNKTPGTPNKYLELITKFPRRKSYSEEELEATQKVIDSLLDQEQLTIDERDYWATKNNRVIYTFNVRDYCQLHKSYIQEEQNHPGIIVVERQSYSIGEQLKGIEKLIDTFSAEQMRNQLVFLGLYIRS